MKDNLVRVKIGNPWNRKKKNRRERIECRIFSSVFFPHLKAIKFYGKPQNMNDISMRLFFVAWCVCVCVCV